MVVVEEDLNMLEQFLVLEFDLPKCLLDVLKNLVRHVQLRFQRFNPL